ncbi:hypothetical protein BH10BDE1_BH10BDE1_32890 [soil metagenome]
MVEDQEIGQLKNSLSSLERRIGDLERHLGLRPKAVDAVQVKPTSVPAMAPMAPTRVSDEAPLGKPQTEISSSGHWLGAIAVVCFVLAAGFIIKLSIESGWLTPERQLGLATLFGLSLIASGILFAKADRDYAGFLPGAGIIILYLTAFAAHRFYSVLSFEACLIATSMISGVCIWIYTRLHHDLYVLTAAVGSYVAPAILSFAVVNSFSVSYFLLCSAAFATVSAWVESRSLSIVASYLAIAMTAIAGSALGQDEFVAIALVIHFLIFAFAAVLQTKNSGVELSRRAAFAYFPVLILFYASEYHFISRINPQLAPWCSLAFAGFLILLYLLAKNWAPEKSFASRGVILGYSTVVLFHSGYLELLPPSARPWLPILILLAAAGLPERFFKPSEKPNWATALPRVAIFAILAIEYVSIIYRLIETVPSAPAIPNLTVGMLTLVALWVCIASLKIRKLATSETRALLVAAHTLAIFGFYNLAKTEGSLAVSAAWLIYAAAVMAFAFWLRDEVMAKSALFVLGLAAAKALLYDASSAPTLVRIFCLLITGVGLYGAGYLMRRISSWNTAR